jgi:hypothetical protein
MLKELVTFIEDHINKKTTKKQPINLHIPNTQMTSAYDFVIPPKFEFYFSK